MTKDEQTKIATLINDISWIRLTVDEKFKNDYRWQEKVDKHLTQLNGSVRTNTSALFGNSPDDSCVLKRLSRVERYLMKWWIWAILLIGASGTGGILSQVLEGIWKRQIPL